MLIGFKYDHRTSLFLFIIGKTVDEVEKGLNDDENHVPIACLFDYSSNSFVKFDKRYKSHLNYFLKAIEDQKDAL